MQTLINELQRLTTPDVISNITHFEVTQVFGHTPSTPNFWNIFTLAVGQGGQNTLPVASKPANLSPQLLQIRSLRDWRIGLHRYALSLGDLTAVICNYATSGSWAPNGHPIAVGRLEPVVGRFAPADGSSSQPWNAILKNNFWSGSHLLELADADKPYVAPLLNHPPALQELSDAIQSFLPLGIARVSDRLGNVVIQLPVEAIFARLGSVSA